MAGGRNESTSEAKVRRQVARTLTNSVVALLVVAAVGAWGWLGVYQLEPGQAAVVLRLGRYLQTLSQPGLKWHLPPPLETHVVVSVAAIAREEFGYQADASTAPGRAELLEAAMQTRDNNIVHLSFVVQYRVKNAFHSRYRIASPREVLRDAAQAAVREVVGRTTIEGVLSEQRDVVQAEAETTLQELLDRYESGLMVLAVQLQDVQPPPEVRDAFDDVIAAAQDRSRAINEAQGYANEILPKARAEAIELGESAQGQRDARVAEATGEASRFLALSREYRKAPRVTRTRLFLETMEEVLPQARKLIVEPGTAVFPLLPLGEGSAPGFPPAIGSRNDGGER
jgi:membrane protease subunit HflK